MPKTKIIIFDNRCRLCSKEIGYYQSVSGSDAFLWCDLHEESNLLERYNISREEALMALHAINEQGHIYKGVDAFLVIWRELPYWRVLASIINFPIIYPLAKVAYKLFANWRYHRLTYCEIK